MSDLRPLFDAARPDLPPTRLCADTIAANARRIRRRRRRVATYSGIAAAAAVIGIGGVLGLPRLGASTVLNTSVPAGSHAPVRVPFRILALPYRWRVTSATGGVGAVVTITTPDYPQDPIEITVRPRGGSLDMGCSGAVCTSEIDIKDTGYVGQVRGAAEFEEEISMTLKNTAFADPGNPATWSTY